VAQDLKEITITLDFKYKGFVLRPEYRHDWSNVASFDDDTRYSQDIIGFGLMYRW
jgi:hypothetical protein